MNQAIPSSKKAKKEGFNIFDFEPSGGHDHYTARSFGAAELGKSFVQGEINVSCPFVMRCDLFSISDVPSVDKPDGEEQASPAAGSGDDGEGANDKENVEKYEGARNQARDALLAELASFNAEFVASDLKVTHGRAQLKIECDDAAALVRDWFGEQFPTLATFLPDGKADDVRFEKLVKAAKPAIFGTSLNRVDCRVDLGALPCVRAHWSGTRKMAILSMLDLQKHLAKKFPTQVPVHSRFMYSWLRDAVAADLQTLLDDGSTFWWATVGPCEAGWLPSASIVFEQTVGVCDCVGVRCSFFCDEDGALEALSAYVDELDAAGSTDTATHQGLEFLRSCVGTK